MTSPAPFPEFERSVRGLTAVGTRRFLLEATATNEVLMAAAEMKRLAGQINVVIHSLGILLCLPHILEVGEQVEKARPAYHPSTLLKIYLYGYLNRIQSSRRLEREAQRNIELMWL